LEDVADMSLESSPIFEKPSTKVLATFPAPPEEEKLTILIDIAKGYQLKRQQKPQLIAKPPPEGGGFGLVI
jgi:hypothetical protein